MLVLFSDISLNINWVPVCLATNPFIGKIKLVGPVLAVDCQEPGCVVVYSRDVQSESKVFHFHSRFSTCVCNKIRNTDVNANLTLCVLVTTESYGAV